MLQSFVPVHQLVSRIRDTWSHSAHNNPFFHSKHRIFVKVANLPPDGSLECSMNVVVQTLLLILVAACPWCCATGTAVLDDGSRCRLSGICDVGSDEKGGVCAHNEFSKAIHGSVEGLVFSDLLARERDARLSCVSSPGERAAKVREAAQWAWRGYDSCASGEDELRPLVCGGKHWLNLTLTAVDSLDTLLIMGLEDEYMSAMHVLERNFSLHSPGYCNVFETTIRVLGGLLSTYFEIEKSTSARVQRTQRMLLDSAIALGARLSQAFASKSGLPHSDVNLRTGEIDFAVSHSSLSEMTTLALEFSALSRLTGHSFFEESIRNVYDVLSNAVRAYDGLLPQYFNPEAGTAQGRYIMLGARTDSYYEYLLKYWIITGKSDDVLKNRYVHAMQSLRKRMLKRTNILPGRQHDIGFLFVSEMEGETMSPKMDHLVCFLPGVFALGHLHGVSTSFPKPPISGEEDEWEVERHKHLWGDDLYIAEELASTCYELYRLSPTGLAPEIAHFIPQDPAYPGNHHSDIGGGLFYVKDNDAHNILRPETVESLFVLWKTTGDPMYRERAWQIFRAFERWTRVEGLELCLARQGHRVKDDIVQTLARLALRKAVDLRSKGRSWEAIANETQKLTTGLLQATRLADLKQGSQVINTASVEVKGAINFLIQSFRSGIIKPGYGNPKWDGDTISNTVCGEIGASSGYAGLQSTKVVPPLRIDKMESFWISETLKYLFLIFSEPPDRCLHTSCKNEPLLKAKYPLTDFVLNTEAHFIPVLGPRTNSTIQQVEYDKNLLYPYPGKSSKVETPPAPLSSTKISPNASRGGDLHSPSDNDGSKLETGLFDNESGAHKDQTSDVQNDDITVHEEL